MYHCWYCHKPQKIGGKQNCSKCHSKINYRGVAVAKNNCFGKGKKSLFEKLFNLI